MGHRAGVKDTATAPADVMANVPAPVAPTGWRRLLTGWDAGLWLLGMWVFGAIITLGLLSFNLSSVRDGSVARQSG